MRRNTPDHTQPGTFVGTPHYSAPEQLAGEEVDQRADIYSSGVLMCEMFCGKLPFTRRQHAGDLHRADAAGADQAVGILAGNSAGARDDHPALPAKGAGRTGIQSAQESGAGTWRLESLIIHMLMAYS